MNKKRLSILTFVVILLILAVFYIIDGYILESDPKVLPPPTITHNFVDLDKIEEISKYRSCTGHVVVPINGTERKRNMKHYFNIKEKYQDSVNGIPIYAPFSADITSIYDIEGKPLDETIGFRSVEDFSFGPIENNWEVSMLHLDVLDELEEGDEVEGGQLIGYAKQNGFDVVYTNYAEPEQQKVIEGWYAPYFELDSIFNHMTEEVFDEYRRAGVESKRDIILTKEQRDNSPCLYRDKAPDLENPNDRDDNWIKLNL